MNSVCEKCLRVNYIEETSEEPARTEPSARRCISILTDLMYLDSQAYEYISVNKITIR